MNGLDCLREEMEKRGCNKAQIESKSVAVVLDIVANSGDKYTKIQEEEANLTRAIAKKEKEIRNLDWRIDNRESRLRELDRKIEIKEQKAEYDNTYIEEFYQALNDCETPEGRDAMKRAQTFINSVDVDTKYDNTAYIIGLAAILSEGNIGAIETLKKINKKLPAFYWDGKTY